MGKKKIFIKNIDKFLWIKKWITFILRIRIANYRYLKFNNARAGGKLIYISN
jgi:hypothetical protein